MSVRVTPGSGSAQNLTLPDAIEAFITWGKPSWRLKTTEAYESFVRRKFGRWAASAGVRLLGEVTAGRLAEFDSYLRKERIADTSRATYLRHVNRFLSWAEEYEEANHLRAQLPRRSPVTKEVLTRKEMAALEAACYTERDRLIVRLLVDTGMRLSEIVNLRVSDLVAEGQARLVKIRGKTGERVASIQPALYNRLVNYRDTLRPPSHSKALFVASRQRKAGEGIVGIEQKGVYEVVRQAHVRTKSTKRCHPHLLRHSNITWRIEQGQNVDHISRETGASVPVLIAHYSHPSVEALYRSTMALFSEED